MKQEIYTKKFKEIMYTGKFNLAAVFLPITVTSFVWSGTDLD